MSDNPDNLRLYASIFNKPRRYSFNSLLMPPSEIELAAVKALLEKAERLEAQKNDQRIDPREPA